MYSLISLSYGLHNIIYYNKNSCRALLAIEVCNISKLHIYSYYNYYYYYFQAI